MIVRDDNIVIELELRLLDVFLRSEDLRWGVVVEGDIVVLFDWIFSSSDCLGFGDKRIVVVNRRVWIELIFLFCGEWWECKELVIRVCFNEGGKLSEEL